GPYGDKAIGQSVVLPPEKIAQALSDLMKEKEVNVTTQRCGVAIPFASSLMSVVELPQVSAKQLSVMVPIEARKYIPVPISEVVLDWSIIPKSGTKIEVEGASQPSAQSEEASATPIPKIDVLVVAIHKDTIARYETIVKQAGLEASFFEIEIFSTMRSVLDDSTTPVMIMDIGAASTKLYIVERGLIQASNTISRGSQDITAAMSKSLGVPLERAEVMKRQFGIAGPDKILTDLIRLTLDYIFEEANRALLAFEKKHNKAVSKVMLVGGGAALKGLAEFAKDNFKTETVAGNPFAKVASPAFLEKVLRETAPEFAVSIGVALRKLAEEE
ncbi:MAG: type IV pilus assembly protein PilM, partial [bacterium]|nr:type IV pilus assembly protein PilM [bacterium]